MVVILSRVRWISHNFCTTEHDSHGSIIIVESAWWFLAASCQFGASASETISMTYSGWPILGVSNVRMAFYTCGSMHTETNCTPFCSRYFQSQFYWNLFQSIRLTISHPWLKNDLASNRRWISDFVVYWCIYASPGSDELTLAMLIFFRRHASTFVIFI